MEKTDGCRNISVVFVLSPSGVGSLQPSQDGEAPRLSVQHLGAPSKLKLDVWLS